MKMKNIKRTLLGLALAGVMVVSSVPVNLLPVSAETWEEVSGTPTLRNYATASVSYVGYGMGADNFADSDMSSFWNAHGDQNLQSKDQWMMYDLGERKAEITGSTIQFYDDGGGVKVPEAITIEYTDENGEWHEVTPKGTWEYKANQQVTYEHEPVTTSKIRITMTHAKNGTTKIPVAVNDWLLLGDVPDDFPKPEVVEPEEPSEDLKLPDAAVYAEPSAHYTSDWENLNGINNADFEPTGSNIGNNLGWGDWPQTAGARAWVQYDWDEPITTKTFQVYWYGTPAGMKVPTGVGFQYKDDNGEWKDAELVSNPKNFSKFNQYNQITIKEITTKTIRMNMTVAGDSCGIYRWKVYSNVPDSFAVTSAVKKLVIPEVYEGKVSSAIYDKITLPETVMDGKVNVTWKSDNTAVIADDGTVTAPEKDTWVTLNATCTMGENKAECEMKVLVLAKDTTEFALNVDTSKEGVDISQELFGVFYEDINSAGDGGMATELVKNNSFENYKNLDTPENPTVKGDQASWKLHWTISNDAGFTVEQTDGINKTNTNYAKITGNNTLKNHGFVRKNSLDKSAMGITEGKTYDFSVYAKAAENYAGTLKVKVVNDAGEAITDEAVIDFKKDGTWNKTKASLTATKTELGTIELDIEGAADTDALYLDMVSLIPTDSFGYGNPNYSCGAGLRADLVQKLKDLNPKFFRFPGGCVVEGSYGTDSYYNWEDTIGPLEERKANASYWGTEGHPVNYVEDYGYMMSYQFGYHEVLSLCEELGAEPFPILSAGIFCQFRDTANAVSGEALEKFAKHATNLIDYCWGDPNSSNETQAKWASKRVANGHEAAFNLNYIGIGNENWNDANKSVSYRDNFIWIKKYVEKYVADNYPGRKITLISSTGPYYQGRQNTDAWNWINQDVPGQTLVDEHYYINYTTDEANTLLKDDYVYDSYKRLNQGGSNVFVGEYAGHNNNTSENILETAISEAAYMTGLERNGDIVRHASYAPLFEKEGCRDWDYNLIKFDEYGSYGTPSYYVQTMFSNNYGKKIVNTTLEKFNDQTEDYEERIGHQEDVYYVSSKDDEYVYLKLVNHDSFAKDITLHYPKIADGTAVEVTSLSGNAFDQNTMQNPTNVAPVTSSAQIQNEKVQYTMPAMSLTVLKVKYAEKAPDNGNQTPDNGNQTPDNGNQTPNTPSQTPDNGSQTTDNSNQTTEAVLKKGDTVTVKGVKYRVTNAAKKQAEAYAPSDKKAKKLTLAGSVKIKGTICKVTAVSANAFAGMKKLTSVSLPKSVVSVGKKAFSGDSKLKTVKFAATAPKTIGKDAFKGIAKKAAISVPKKQLKIYKKLLKKAKYSGKIK